jgi:hypothetical protein
MLNDSTSSVNDSSTEIQWVWNPNKNLLDEFDRIKWTPFPDTDNRIIEEAFGANQTHVILDNCRIDFESMSQISIDVDGQQRLVRRETYRRGAKRSRDKYVVSDPILPLWQFNGPCGWISVFIQEVRKALKVNKQQLFSEDKTFIRIIVEKAAQGIIEEGKAIGRLREAERIAQTLREHSNKEIREVWKCCAYLFTLDTFLFQVLNETMRLVGSEEHESIWRSKIDTLGPYCLLLWDDPFNNKPNTSNEVLFRGVNLSADMIAAFEKRSPTEHGTFQAFSACTRNRRVAEQFGNVIFIIKVIYAYTMDLSSFSRFPEEEEVLVHPGVCFSVSHVELDRTANKHLIYLDLDHRLNGEYDTYKTLINLSTSCFYLN